MSKKTKINLKRKCQNCSKQIIIHRPNRNSGLCALCHKNAYWLKTHPAKMGKCKECQQELNLRTYTSGFCSSCRLKSHNFSALKHWYKNKARLLEIKKQERKNETPEQREKTALYQVIYRKNNPIDKDKANKYKKNYWKQNPEKYKELLEKVRIRYKENPEKAKLRARNYYKLHSKEQLEHRRIRYREQVILKRERNLQTETKPDDRPIN